MPNRQVEDNHGNTGGKKCGRGRVHADLFKAIAIGLGIGGDPSDRPENRRGKKTLQPQGHQALSWPFVSGRVLVRLGKQPVIERKNDDPHEHSHRRRGESRMPATNLPSGAEIDGMVGHVIPHKGGNKVANERPKIDAHVKNVVTGVSQRTIRLI